MKPIFKDETSSDAKVKFIKVNCVDFDEVCKKQQIRGFPELRFYTKDGNFRRFTGQRDKEKIKNFITVQVRGLTSSEGATPTRAARERKGGGDSTVLGSV